MHLTTEDVAGAGRAARRISHALCEYGVDSSVIVLDKITQDNNVQEYWKSRLNKFGFKVCRKLYRKVLYRNQKENMFYSSHLGVNLMKNQQVREADIINLHWVNHCYLSMEEICKISKQKKVVWTLHDMWPFTAGCYYDQNCGGYMNGCIDCKLRAGVSKAFVAQQGKRKKDLYDQCAITMVGCSHWITQCAYKSKITSHCKFATIPNPIDLTLFQPMDQAELRRKYGIPREKRVVLFGALSSNSDQRKGYLHLRDALRQLDPQKYTAVIFGNSSDFKGEDLAIPVKVMGTISDDSILAEVYNLADVFVAPSVQENLANSVVESLSCGVPVVAFRIGGMVDMIQSNVNGYLAKPFDSNDLSAGIELCVSNPDFGAAARKTACMKFSNDVVAKQYYDVYKP